jgi:hypothetical protein
MAGKNMPWPPTSQMVGSPDDVVVIVGVVVARRRLDAAMVGVICMLTVIAISVSIVGVIFIAEVLSWPLAKCM